MKRSQLALAAFCVCAAAAALAAAVIPAATAVAVPVVVPAPAQAGMQAADNVPAWLRYPAISPDGATIVFAYKGDLFRVPSDGGVAVPLTMHEAHDYMPVWSHDGRSVAFASDRFGNFDVFVMPAAGGEARRLTFHSASELPFSFTPDDKAILFGAARADTAASRLFPTGSQPELYKVPVAGGRVVQILGTPAEDARLSRDGRLLIYHDKKGGENTWRKHHASAITRDIWIYDTKAGTHRKLTTFAGEDRSPTFADNDQAFYYLSEESGTFNVQKMSLQGGKPQVLTSFKTVPVRFLTAADNGTLCFGQDGQIYTMKPSGQPQKVGVAMAVDARSNNERVVPVTGGVAGLAISPNGKEVAFVFRGEVFVTAVEGSATKRVTNTPEQERGVSFSPDGKSLIYVSERNGRWGAYETRRTREDEPYFYASSGRHR
jgi:tricorn protease